QNDKGVSVDQTVSNTVTPKSVTMDVKVDTEIRYRGIFRVPVYTAEIRVSGVIGAGAVNGRILPERVTLDTGVSDLRGLVEQPQLTIGGRQITFEPGASQYGTSAISAPLGAVPAEGTPFSYVLKLHGTDSLEIMPSGKEMNVTMTSPWTTPSFIGGVLPAKYDITPSGFTSQWTVSPWWADGGTQMQTAYDEYGNAYGHNQPGPTFGVKLLETTDFYTLVDRAIKYAILFIGLTFLVLFLVEVLHTERVHPFQYILVGAALCLFYLLLLSLSEHIGFLPAYLISAVATVALVSGYSISVLRHKKFGTSVGVLLAVLYGYLYLLLQIEDYALLFGSVILFMILAAVMYVTRNVDWYGKDPS
ncbi:MAG TPA: cell envelope integrity protein CreD, partial [Candidatus Peribacteria bacterium]|nr:cell envelope integrity protein CreD [Candidatus Peribacteria bacterium]